MVKRILLISNFGPIYIADYIYKYLMREKVEVYTVGNTFSDKLKPFSETIQRCYLNHINLMFNWRMKKQPDKSFKRVRFSFDIASIFDLTSDDFDAVLEIETQNLEVRDRTNCLENKGIPYYFYKTEKMLDYYNPYATHFFYSSELVKTHLLSLLPKHKRNMPMYWLPFSMDPELIPENDPKTYQYSKLFFAGGYPGDKAEPRFHEIYENRIKILQYLNLNLDGEFLFMPHRQLHYLDYLGFALKSEIMLNIGIGCTNFRDFEAMALGKPLLTLDNPEYQKLGLTDGVMYKSFKTPDEALDKTRELLDNSEYRRDLGNNAKRVFEAAHTPTHRAKQILEVIYNG